MSILLTGGTGYIGSHTAVVLAQLGFPIVLLDNLSNSDISVAKRIELITGVKIHFVQGDVRDTQLIKTTLIEHQVKAVIHFAGLKSVGESFEKPIDYYANNVHGAISLLEGMEATDVRALVFSSSATVYGEPHYLPIDEAHPTSATNPYGRTKLQIEDMLKDLAASSEKWHIAILRYFNPVGAHQSGLIGESPKGVPNNLMPYLLQVATGVRPCLSVFGDDYLTVDGTGVRDYVHVMDLAEGHAAALRHIQGNAGCDIFNLGTGVGTSVLELMAAFESACKQKIKYSLAPRRPGDAAICYANNQKALNTLKWKATKSLADMCSNSWMFQCKSVDSSK